MPVPFTFGIPLIAREVADDWDRVEGLLDLTLTSILAQTDGDFELVIAGHDRPRRLPDDPRVAWLPATWPVAPVDEYNRDGGRKKDAIASRVRERGGLLMFVDADDWVDTRLVACARAQLGDAEAEVGGVVAGGFAVAFSPALPCARLPDPRLGDLEFHRLCGSSVVLRLRPGDPDPLRENPYALLHEHSRCVELAAARGLALAWLPVDGAYVVDAGIGHSERHGPFAAWRQQFNANLRAHGLALDHTQAAGFGLTLERIRAAT